MRQLPQELPEDGILVGWSLEPGRRRSVIGFYQESSQDRSTTQYLEPILDTGEGHLLTVAPTGGGKGTGCIVPTLLRYRGPVVVVDPKGENYLITAQRRRDLGQEVVLLDPFGVTGDPRRHRFNPLDLADPSSPRFVEDVATLAGLLSAAPPAHENNLFWYQMGKALVSAAIIDVMTMPDSEAAHLPAVRSLVHLSPVALAERAQKWKDQGSPELQRLASLLFNPAEETFGGYWSHAIQILDFLKGEQIEDHLGASDLDLNAIYEGAPLSIYLVLPPDKLESHAGLLRLWIGTFIGAITRRKKQPARSTLFLVDEAAQLGSFAPLKQAITLLRGYGVRVWTFWQDLSQLRHHYPLDWETILNNSRVQQYFGVNSGLAAEAVSSVSGFSSTETILNLERDEMILNVSGDESVIAGTPNYRWDPPFRGLYSPNPFYPQQEAPDGRRTRPVYRKTSSPAHQLRQRTARTSHLLAQQIFLPVEPAQWVTVDAATRVDVLRRIGITEQGFLDDERILVRRCALSFYPDCDWYDVDDGRTSPHQHGHYLVASDSVHRLTGESKPFYDVARSGFLLTRPNAQLYLEFFCSNLISDSGRFLVIESVDEIEWVEEPDASIVEDLRPLIRPPRILSTGTKSDPGWTMEANILFDSSLFLSILRIDPASGEVAMVEDTPLAGDLPVLPDCQRLQFIGWFHPDGRFEPWVSFRPSP